MTRLDVATGRGTARARRWLTRALFVMGGAMAGTAAAWAISTASASAAPDPSCSPHLAAAASDVVQPGSIDRHGCESRAVTDDVREMVGAVADGEMAHPAPNAASPLDLLTDPPQQAPRVIGGTLHPAPALVELLRPESGPLFQVPALPSLEPQAGTDAGPVPAARTPLAAPDGQAGSLISSPTAAGPQEAKSDRIAARSGHHTAGRPLWAPVPLTPSHTPLTPPALPLPGGSATNAHADGPVFGVPAPASVFLAADSPQGVRFGTRRTPVEPGTQPGVTPD